MPGRLNCISPLVPGMLCAVGQVTVTSPRHRLLDNLTLAVSPTATHSTATNRAFAPPMALQQHALLKVQLSERLRLKARKRVICKRAKCTRDIC